VTFCLRSDHAVLDRMYERRRDLFRPRDWRQPAPAGAHGVPPASSASRRAAVTVNARGQLDCRAWNTGAFWAVMLESYCASIAEPLVPGGILLVGVQNC
jgi:hypothetical protein